MMRGDAHDRVHGIGLGVMSACLAGAVVGGGLSVAEAAALWCGYAAGRALTPDLDLARSRAQRALRVLLPLRILGLAYARVFKHRGISHWPVVGTLTRVLWFATPFLALALLLGAELHVSSDALRILTLGFMGLSAADLLHIATDLMTRRRSRIKAR